MTTDSTFNREGLLKRSMGDEELMLQIIQAFLQSKEEAIAKLQQAISEQDGTKIRNRAHSIKGSAANVGGVRLQDIAMQIEMCGASGDYDGATKLMPELVKRFDELQVVLAVQ